MSSIEEIPNTLRAPRTPSWYAISTRSRQEKLVEEQLAGQGIEPFLPFAKRWSRWKDRRKWVEIPLFPGYCLGRFRLEERLLILSRHRRERDPSGSGPEDRCRRCRSRLRNFPRSDTQLAEEPE